MASKTSILIVNSGKEEARHWHIPTFLIKGWKRISVLFAIVVVLLLSTIVYLVQNNRAEQISKDAFYEQQLAKANQRYQKIAQVVDVEKLEASFDNIDSSMNRINTYLQKRGLPTSKNPNAGGGSDLTQEDLNIAASFYANSLKELENKISYIPLGVPYKGEVSSTFGTRHNPFSGEGVEVHKGLDFKGRIGDTIRATANGMVAEAGVKGGYGNCVVLTHKHGYQTLYGHLNRVLVKPGSKIAAGTIIGLLGSTGRSTGPHLHYEVIRDGQKIDPSNFLKL